VLEDSTYIKFPETSNAQRTKEKWWFPDRLGGGGGSYLTDVEFQFRGGACEKKLEMDGGDGCITT
jgi:hypothetical protein